MTSDNTFEHEARRRKAQRLLTALDASVRESGKDPIKDGEHVADMILLAPPDGEWWADLARSAGCKPPSAKTIALLAHQVRARTREHADECQACKWGTDSEDWPIT